MKIKIFNITIRIIYLILFISLSKFKKRKRKKNQLIPNPLDSGLIKLFEVHEL